MTWSKPPKAATAISMVDSGRWKFDTTASGTENSYGGKMNLFVHPS